MQGAGADLDAVGGGVGVVGGVGRFGAGAPRVELYLNGAHLRRGGPRVAGRGGETHVAYAALRDVPGGPFPGGGLVEGYRYFRIVVFDAQMAIGESESGGGAGEPDGFVPFGYLVGGDGDVDGGGGGCGTGGDGDVEGVGGGGEVGGGSAAAGHPRTNRPHFHRHRDVPAEGVGGGVQSDGYFGRDRRSVFGQG